MDVNRRCAKCGEVKSESEFHVSSARGRQAWCKPCRKVYDAEYHKKRAVVRRRQSVLRRRAIGEWYRSLKNAPCVACGRRFHHSAMQWDHLPGTTKRDDLGRLVNGHGRRAILEEIEKCELVCANCHAVRTFERRRGVAQPG